MVCRRHTLVAFAITLASVAVAGTAIAAIGSNSVLFRDSRNETAKAPDITTVAVSNDDGGLITFKVAVPNRPVFTGDMDVAAYINADGNAKNGAGPKYDGAEYKLDVIPDDGIALGRWVNGKWNYDGPQPESLTSSYNKGVVMTVQAADLNLTSFKFYVYFRDARGARDFAPDAGKPDYSYVVK